MTGIQHILEKILNTALWAHDADLIAAEIITELGLTEFECDGERWWATKLYPIEETTE